MNTPEVPAEVTAERIATWEAHGKNQTHAAKALGIQRSTLQNTLKAAGLMSSRGRQPTLTRRAINARDVAVDNAANRAAREFDKIIEIRRKAYLAAVERERKQ